MDAARRRDLCMTAAEPSEMPGADLRTKEDRYPENRIGRPTRSSTAPAASAITTKLRLRTDKNRAFAVWQAAFTRVVSGFPGFLSVEIIAAFPGASEWRIVQRFHTPQQLAVWRNAPERGRLVAEVAPLLDPDSSASDEEAAPDFHSLHCVTEIITTDVKPGQEGQFLAWCEAIQACQGSFPGYAGTLVQAPSGAGQPYWATLVRFATPQCLDAWLTSPRRQALLRRSEPLVRSWHARRLPHPFAGWFPSGADGAAPPLWKQAMLVLLVLYPVVMLELRFLNPVLAGWTPAAATFVGNAISVGLVTWPLMPATVMGMGWWLNPSPQRPMHSTGLGLVLVGLLYTVELLLLSKLL